MAKTIALDFDGVINSYGSGFIENRIPDPPVKGALAFILALQSSGHTVVIHTCRATDQNGIELIRNYLLRHGLDSKSIARIQITNRKPPAGLYIDDRGCRFTGKFPTIEEVDQMAWNAGTQVATSLEGFQIPVDDAPQSEDTEPQGSVDESVEPLPSESVATPEVEAFTSTSGVAATKSSRRAKSSKRR